MAIIQQTVRLYKVHDMDILSYVIDYEFNIKKAIYCSLKAFCKGNIFVIKTPPVRVDRAEINRVYTFSIGFDTRKDADIINLLSRLKRGRKNNFIKNILRLYLCNPISPEFLLDEKDVGYFKAKFQIFYNGRIEANAGSFIGKTQNEKKKKVSVKEETEIISDYDPVADEIARMEMNLWNGVGDEIFGADQNNNQDVLHDPQLRQDVFEENNGLSGKPDKGDKDQIDQVEQKNVVGDDKDNDVDDGKLTMLFSSLLS